MVLIFTMNIIIVLNVIALVILASGRSVKDLKEQVENEVTQSIEQNDQKRLQVFLFQEIDNGLHNFVSNVLCKGFLKAAKEGKTDLLKVFLTDKRVHADISKNKAFIDAAAYGRTEVVDFLLSLNEINPFSRHNAALRYSASSGHSDIVERILNISIDIRRKFGQIESAWSSSLGESLRLASENGRVNTVQLLLDHGVIPSYLTIVSTFEKYNECKREEEVLQVYQEEAIKTMNAIGQYTANERNQVLDHILNFLPGSNLIQNQLKVKEYKKNLELLLLKAQENDEYLKEVFETARVRDSELYDFLVRMPQIKIDIKRKFQGKRVRFKENKL